MLAHPPLVLVVEPGIIVPVAMFVVEKVISRPPEFVEETKVDVLESVVDSVIPWFVVDI